MCFGMLKKKISGPYTRNADCGGLRVVRLIFWFMLFCVWVFLDSQLDWKDLQPGQLFRSPCWKELRGWCHAVLAQFWESLLLKKQHHISVMYVFEWERQRVLSCCFTPQLPTKARAYLAGAKTGRQKQPRSSSQMTGTQLLEPSLATSHGLH